MDLPPEGLPTELSNYVIEGSGSFLQGREVRWGPTSRGDVSLAGCQGERAEAVAQIGNYVVHVRWQATLTARGWAERHVATTSDKMRAMGVVD